MTESKKLDDEYFYIAREESGIDLENCEIPASFPDPVAATAGFNMAVLLFHRMRKQSALTMVRSILRSPKMPDSLLCEASLLEVSILLDFRQTKLLLAVMKSFQAKPWWAAASPKQKETSQRLVTKARMLMSPEKFSVALRDDSLQWIVCQAQMDARTGDAKKSISKLLSMRMKASDEQVLIDNTLGCIYGSVLKNHDFAEAFFRSAMKGTTFETCLGSCGTVPRAVLVYNFALCLTSQGKYQDAYKMFVLTMPYYQHLPRYWLRLAECCLAALLSDEQKSPEKKNPSEASLAKGVVMQARYRKGILAEPPGFQTFMDGTCGDLTQSLRMGQLPAISYSNALACLRNATTLGGDERNYVCLLSTIHELTAFVSLQLRAPGLALRSATAILNLPQSTNNPYMYIKGVLLKAEAMVALGQVHQAVALLEQITNAAQSMSSQIAGLTTIAYNYCLLSAKIGDVKKAIDIYEQMKAMPCTDNNISHFIALERYLQTLVKRSRPLTSAVNTIEANENRRFDA
uniref:CCR4-NOT transcription complex subunit 10 n=1 Tax=Steinernema glaseri TaxID=37863 RepID=A0A1I7YY91_9BILA